MRMNDDTQDGIGLWAVIILVMAAMAIFLATVLGPSRTAELRRFLPMSDTQVRLNQLPQI